MMKPKQKHLTAVVVESNSTQSSAENPLNIVNSDLSVGNSWVVVKKQRVNILIPPLPSTEPSTSMLDPGQAQLPGDMLSNSINTTTQIPYETPPEVCVAERNDGSSSLSPKTNIVSTREVYPPPSDVVAINLKTSKPSSRKMNNEERIATLRDFHKEKRSVMHKGSFGLKPLRSFEQSGLYGVGKITSATTLRDKMMKASNLERKIVRSGGLDRWLSSMGLEQFTRIFHGKKITKFQLVNLSMKKLKDMGAHAVGPRRKLIHAIECAILF